MNQFEKDKQEIKNGNGILVMKRRKKEIDDLYKKGQKEKNGFKKQCLAQDYARLKYEYNKLDSMI